MNFKTILTMLALLMGVSLAQAQPASTNYGPKLSFGSLRLPGGGSAGQLLYDNSGVVSETAGLTYSSSTQILATRGVDVSGSIRVYRSGTLYATISTLSGAMLYQNATASTNLRLNDGDGTAIGYIRSGRSNTTTGLSIGYVVGQPASGQLLLLNSNNPSSNYGNINGSFGAGFINTPSATLHISGTSILGNCATNVTCGAQQAGAMCYRAANNVYYFCDGANSWTPITTSTKVSASAF